MCLVKWLSSHRHVEAGGSAGAVRLPVTKKKKAKGTSEGNSTQWVDRSLESSRVRTCLNESHDEEE